MNKSTILLIIFWGLTYGKTLNEINSSNNNYKIMRVHGGVVVHWCEIDVGIE